MSKPQVSIVMPVYNAARHLEQAMNSVLTQSFTDFEFIIVNDGSTDNSESIVSAYSDERIKYIPLPMNVGLPNALNKGVEAATGKYIARMDGDDICLQDRLAVQKKWLDDHPDTAVTACHIRFITETGEEAGTWQLDLDTSSAPSIRRVLARQNCIAHPGVMGRTEIFKEYRYSPYQRNIDDYDLWLRLVADGKIIDKTDPVLLHYRIHSEQVTKVFLQSPFTQFNCKRKFLYHRLRAGKFTFFDCRVFMYMIKDGLTGIVKTVKRILHNKR
jgi:glycosyltransferase involved in cell wall biosynthesis